MKAIGKGAVAAGSIALGTGTGGLPAIAAAAAIGGVSGFGTNAVKSWAMENVVPKDYQSLEGISNEVPKDARRVGDDIADEIRDLGSPQEGDVTATETGGEGGAGANNELTDQADGKDGIRPDDSSSPEHSSETHDETSETETE